MTQPRTVIHFQTGPGWRHPADVCPAQAALAILDASSPQVTAWVRRYVGTPANRLDAAQRLLAATAASIRYVRDPDGQQYVTAPRHVVDDGAGDCKKESTLIASAAYGLGVPFRFAVTAQQHPDMPNHVWAELLTEQGWTAVDPVPWQMGRGPLRLGRLVDGRIETWNPYAQEETTMRTAPVRTDRAVPVRQVGMGAAGASTALDAAQGALASAGPYGALAATALAALRRVAGVLMTGSHSPYDYILRWVADNVAHIRLTKAGSTDPQDRAYNFADLLAQGWIVGYCSDSAGTVRDAVREFAARGWPSEQVQSGSTGYITDIYPLDELGIRKETHYAIVLRVDRCPAALLAAAKRRYDADPTTAVDRAFHTAFTLKNQERTYGGDSDWDRIVETVAICALPVAATAPVHALTTSTTTASTTSTGLPATARPATSAAPTATAVTPPLPAGARLVSGPTAAPPAGLPQAARPVAAPDVYGAGALTSEEQSVVAAMRLRRGVDIARRAGAAARAFGLGAAATVQIADDATDATITAGLPSRETINNTTPIKARSAMVNFALAHIGEGVNTRRQVAEKVLAWKRALGITDPAGSRINDALRELLAAQGGFPLGAVPTLDQIAARLTGGAAAPADAATQAAAAAGMPAGSRLVGASSATSSSTTTGNLPGAGAAPLDSTAAGLPAGARAIAPAPATGPSTSSDALPMFVLGVLVARHRRAA